MLVSRISLEDTSKFFFILLSNIPCFFSKLGEILTSTKSGTSKQALSHSFPQSGSDGNHLVILSVQCTCCLFAGVKVEQRLEIQIRSINFFFSRFFFFHEI